MINERPSVLHAHRLSLILFTQVSTLTGAAKRFVSVMGTGKIRQWHNGIEVTAGCSHITSGSIQICALPTGLMNLEGFEYKTLLLSPSTRMLPVMLTRSTDPCSIHFPWPDDPVDVCFSSFAMSSIFPCSFTSLRFSTACICCLISGCEFIMAINCACVTPCPC